MFAITAAIVTGVLGALWQERCEKRAAEASRTAPATAYGPLVRPVALSPFPALRPLTEAERAELARLDWEHIMHAIGDLEDDRG
jgi:hypothetical protein